MNDQTTMTGGCVCGAVTWEIDGEPAKFLHCHCSRCRRTTGTGHASNLIVPITSEIRWTGSEDDRRSYKLPDAERFTTHFCSRCGSVVPAREPDRELFAVPAGSLDSEAGVREKLHIFTGSKAPWFEIRDGLPQLEESP